MLEQQEYDCVALTRVYRSCVSCPAYHARSPFRELCSGSGACKKKGKNLNDFVAEGNTVSGENLRD